MLSKLVILYWAALMTILRSGACNPQVGHAARINEIARCGKMQLECNVCPSHVFIHLHSLCMVDIYCLLNPRGLCICSALLLGMFHWGSLGDTSVHETFPMAFLCLSHVCVTQQWLFMSVFLWGKGRIAFFDILSIKWFCRWEVKFWNKVKKN